MEGTVFKNGRVTIPKEVRVQLNLKPGDKVKFFFHPDGHVMILPKLLASALKGIVKSRYLRLATRPGRADRPSALQRFACNHLVGNVVVGRHAAATQ